MSEYWHKHLDPGVRRLVAVINTLGFTTTDSGDGVSKPIVDGVLPFPHVVIPARNPISTGMRLAHLLTAQHGVIWGEQGTGRPCLQATWDYATKAGTVMVMDLNDESLAAFEAKR